MSQLFQDSSANIVTNVAQSPDVVEACIGDLVDVVLHGQLAVLVVSPGRQRRTRLQTQT